MPRRGAAWSTRASILDLLSRHKVYIDVLVLDELIYVPKKKYGVPYTLTLEFIESIVLPYTAAVGCVRRSTGRHLGW